VTKLLTALFLAALCTSALAAKTPVDITLEAKKAGNVPFPHKLHAARGCKACHPASPTKIANLSDRDTAHALCKDCHEKASKGPTKCDGCHKR
jgi:hypothetical protein